MNIAFEDKEIITPDFSVVDTVKGVENSAVYRVSKEKLEKMSAELETMKLEGPEDEARIVNFLIDIKKDAKEVKGLWDKMIFGADTIIKAMKPMFKPKMDMYSDLEDKAKEKLDDYRKRQRRKADDEARKLEEIRQKEQAKLDAKHAKKVEKAVEKGVEPPPPPMPVLPASVPVQSVAKTNKTEQGSVTYRKVPMWEVADVKLIPAEYFVLDESKIGKLVRNGLRNIPGIRIWEEEQSSIRPS